MNEYYKQICDRSEYNGYCLEWKGALNDAGYGVKKIEDKFWYVHRWSYTVNHGDIPGGMTVDHICHNSKCHNPKHLRLLTHSENCRDGAMYALKNRGYSFPTLICDNCGLEFTTTESYIRTKKKRGYKTSCCSKSCSSILNKGNNGAKKCLEGETFVLNKNGVTSIIEGIEPTLEFIGGKYNGLYNCVKGYRNTYLGYEITLQKMTPSYK